MKRKTDTKFINIDSIKESISKKFNINKLSNKEHSISIRCPFCGDKKYHMGLNFEINAYNCFRCSKSGKLTKFLTLNKIPFSTWTIGHVLETGSVYEENENPFEGKISLFTTKNDNKDTTFTIPRDKEINKTMLSKFHSYLTYRGINHSLVKESVKFYPITEKNNEFYGYIIVPIGNKSFYGRKYTSLPTFKQKHIIRKSSDMIGTPTYLFIDDNKSKTIVVVESFFNLLKLIQNGYSALCTFGKSNIRSVEEFMKKNEIENERTICFCYDSDVPILEVHDFLKKFYKNCNIKNPVTFIHPHSMKHNDIAEYENNELKKLIDNNQIDAEKIFINLFLPQYIS